VSLFGKRRKLSERELGDPDWDNVAQYLQPGEQRIDACSGWSVGEGVDHPCAVYLTDRAIYVDVRPDASLTGFETIIIPFKEMARCAVQAGPSGSPRMVAVSMPEGSENPEDARGVAVDLRPESDARRFAQEIAQHAER